MKARTTALMMIASTLLWTAAAPGTAIAADSYKTAGGLAVYLGVLPAAMVQGHPEKAMHTGDSRGRYDYHVMAVVFDATRGVRIEDATVEARVTPLGLGGVTRRLEPMLIEGTVTYGNYFTMRDDGIYRILFSIRRAGTARPTVLEFSYDHQTR